MSDSIVTFKAHVRDGQVIDVQIHQDRRPLSSAAVFIPAPRRIDGLLHMLRHCLRMERERTRA